MFSKKNILFFIIMLIALGIYLASLEYNYIGQYNDDAWYINASRYLAGVPHSIKNINGRPLGYPIMLAPLAKLFPDSINVFRFPSLIMIFLIPLICYFCLSDVFRGYFAILLSGLLAFNQFSIILSGDVLAEVPFLFFIIISAAYFQKKCISKPDIKNILVLSLLTVSMIYLKTIGFLVFVSFSIYYLTQKEFKTVLYYVFFVLLLSVPVLFTDSAMGSSLDKYFFELGTTYGRASLLNSALANLGYYFKFSTLTAVLGIVRTPYTGLFFKQYIWQLSAFIISCIILIGLIRSMRENYLRPFSIFLILILLVNILWVNVSIRYLIPIFPFMIVYFFYAFKDMNRKFRYSILILFYISYAITAFYIIAAPINDRGSLSAQTYNWIKENTQKNARFYGNFAARFFLYTNREMLLLEHRSKDEFYQKLVQNAVDYICLSSTEKLQKSFKYSHQRNNHVRTALYITDTGCYEMIYQNPDEKMTVLRVKKDPEYLNALTFYRESLQKFTVGDIDGAIVDLTESLRLFPCIESVVMELVSMYIIKKEYIRALELLEKALMSNPHSPYLISLKARIHVYLGLETEAKILWIKALETAKKIGALDLQQQIKKDMNSSFK